MDRRWLVAPLAIWLVSLFLVQVLGALAAPASGMPSDCPEDSQNCARGTMGFDADPSEVLAAATAWQEPQMISTGEGEAHVVHHTRWMHYADDMFLEAGCNENGTWLHVHSESRLGISDLGVNQQRIDALFAYLDELDLEAHDC